MSNIVFVQPPLTREERYGVKSQGGGETPPIGLAILAAMARKNGFETAIIDAERQRMSDEEVTKEIISKNFRHVGITSVTIAIDNAARLAQAVKVADPGITVIVGGPHLTAVPEETMKRYTVFDIGVIGEGDYTIIKLLKCLEGNGNLGDVKGIIFRRNGTTHCTPPRTGVENMDELPKPAWDLLPDLATHYCPPVHTLKRVPAALLVASRGCPMKCNFCARSVFGNNCRAYSAEYTFEMIKGLMCRYGIREIQLRDDNFTALRRRLIELCEIIIREQVDVTWSCAARVDMINENVLKVMKKAGCWQIWYGIESGSQKVLDAIKKGTKVEQIEEAIRLTKRAGISPCGFFMLGCPTETKETLEETINFSLKLELDECHFCFYTPFPGTEIYAKADQYGSFDNDWKNLNGWLPVFIPKDLTVEELESYSKKAFRKFYWRPRIVLSYLMKIRSFRHLRIYILGFIALLEWIIRNKRDKVDVKPLGADNQ